MEVKFKQLSENEILTTVNEEVNEMKLSKIIKTRLIDIS